MARLSTPPRGTIATALRGVVSRSSGPGRPRCNFVPELAKEAADLTVYQRTPIHVVPKIDFAIPTVMQRLFARLPLMQRVFRWVTDTIFELITVSVLHYPQFRRLYIAAADLAKINRFVSIRDKELRRKLTPDYDFGCKRPTWVQRLLPRLYQTACAPGDKPDRADRAGRYRRCRRAQDRH